MTQHYGCASLHWDIWVKREVWIHKYFVKIELTCKKNNRRYILTEGNTAREKVVCRHILNLCSHLGYFAYDGRETLLTLLAVPFKYRDIYFCGTDSLIREMFDEAGVTIHLSITRDRLINFVYPNVNMNTEILKLYDIIFSETVLRNIYNLVITNRIQLNDVDGHDFELVYKPAMMEAHFVIKAHHAPQPILVMDCFKKVICPSGNFFNILHNLIADGMTYNGIRSIFRGIKFLVLDKYRNHPYFSNYLFGGTIELQSFDENIATMDAGNVTFQCPLKMLEIIPNQILEFNRLPNLLKEILLKDHVVAFRKIAEPFGLDVLNQMFHVQAL